MAIEIRSDEWTGAEHPKAGQPNAAPTGTPHVCGEFQDGAKLDEALSRLEGAMFQRADLSVRKPGQEDTSATSVTEEATRDDDTRNLRTLASSTGGTIAAFAAAGVVVATGGAALPAVLAAAAAGGGFAALNSGLASGDSDQHVAADSGGATLMVNAVTPDKRARAEEILRECGAVRVWTIGSATA